MEFTMQLRRARVVAQAASAAAAAEEPSAASSDTMKVGEKRKRDDAEDVVLESKRGRPDEEASDRAIKVIACIARCGFAADVLPALRSCKSLYHDVDLWRLVHRAETKASLLEMAASSGNPHRVRGLIRLKLFKKADVPKAIVQAIETPAGDSRTDLLLFLLQHTRRLPTDCLPKLIANKELEEVALEGLRRADVRAAFTFWNSADAAKKIEEHNWQRMALSVANLEVRQTALPRLMYVACRKGWQGVLTALLRNGAAPKSHHYPNGPSPLNEAAAAGHVGIIDLLLAAGADINNERYLWGTNHSPPSPLAAAVKAGRLQAVCLLLERGCSHDHNALVEACTEGRPEVLSALMRAWYPSGAGSMPPECLRSCLRAACRGGHARAITDFIGRSRNGLNIAAGPETTARLASAVKHVCASTLSSQRIEQLVLQLLKASPAGSAAAVAAQCSEELLSAIRNGQKKLALKLLDGGAPYANAVPGSSGGAILQAATAACMVDVVSKILSLAAASGKLEIFKPVFPDLLGCALQGGSEDIAGLFIQHGADWCCVSDSSHAFLHRACSAGMEKTAMKLLDLGVALRQEPRSERSEIHAACCSGLTSVVSRLIKECPSLVHAPDSSGALPLHAASTAGHVAVIKVLIDEGGADVNGGAPRTNSGKTPLYCASEAGHVEAVRALLERGASVKFKSFQGASALSGAARFCRSQVVSVLVTCPDAAVLVNDRDVDGHTPLTLAVGSRCSDIVRHLLTVEGADPNVWCALDSEPCLHRALRLQDEETAKQLLDGGADASLRGNRSRTPAHIAAELGLAGSLALLAARGADLVSTDAHGLFPLAIAASHGHLPALQTLLSSSTVNCNIHDWKGKTALMHAAAGGHEETVKALIAAGADLDAQDLEGRTALFQAVASNKTYTAVALIDAGANVNLVDFCDCSPLLMACKQGFVTMAQMLILKGANVLTEDQRGERPVFCCYSNSLLFPVGFWMVEKGENPNILCLGDDRSTGTLLQSFVAKDAPLACIRRLIALGADINVRDVNGQSVLAAACSKKNSKLAFCLLEAGADPMAANKSGETVLDVACRIGLEDFALELLERGAYGAQKDREVSSTVQAPLSAAFRAGRGSAKVVGRLLELGAPMDGIVCGGGITPFACALNWDFWDMAAALFLPHQKVEARDFHRAVDRGGVAFVIACINAGFDANALDAYGVPALHRACKELSVQMVEALLRHGANVNLIANGLTPLQAACSKAEHVREERRLEVVTLLLKHGADARAVNSQGSHVLHLLPYQKEDFDVKAIGLLVDAGAPVDAADATGRTALVIACAQANAAAVLALLRKRANPHAPNRSGQLIPLHLVVAYGSAPQPHAMLMLLQAGASVNARDDVGRSPLHLLATRPARIAVMQYLLQQPGIDVNAVDRFGMTPLHLAAHKGFCDIVQLLLKAKANVFARAKDGKSPGQMTSNPAVVKLLSTEARPQVPNWGWRGR